MDKLADLEQIGEFSNYARALWNAGRTDDAWQAFEAQVEQSYSKSAQWLQVAGFMEMRGAGEFAALAYDRAVRSTDPGNNRPAALLARAKHLIWQGHFDAAVADYSAVADSVYGPDYAFQTMVSAFGQIGRREFALEAARAQGSPFKHLAPPTFDAGALGLPTDELAGRVAALASGGYFYDVTRTLTEHGRADVIDSLIRQRLARGNHSAALHLLSSSKEALVEADLFEPLLSEIVSKQAGRAERQVDILRLEQHLRKGDYARAMGIFERWNNRGSQGPPVSLHLAAKPEALDGVALGRQLRFAPSPVELSVDFHRFARPDELSQLLRQSAESNVYLNRSVELHLSDLFARGGGMAVFSLLRRRADALVHDGKLVSERTASNQLLANRADYVRALALVAAHGYAEEVAALVEALPTATATLSGTGPSYTAVGDSAVLESLEDVWSRRDGHTWLTTTQRTGAATR
jgi:tetratricopeptide (TPR) repeat protein